MSQLNPRPLPQISDPHVIATFEKRYEAEPNTGCWLWLGALFNNGYGQFRIESRTQLAHRVAFAIYKSAIPPKWHVLHKCDNPLCVNPSHLYLGTHQQNMEDRGKRGRSRGGSLVGIACPWAKLTEDAVRAIRSDSRSATIAADTYGISESQFYRIKRRERWGSVA